MSKLISYTKLESTLSKLGAQLNAAETHGLMTGLLTITSPQKHEAWRSVLLENLDCSTPSQVQWKIFSNTGSQIMHDFTEQNFAFNLLLPSDDQPLQERADALVLWCRGYLSGLGLIGITQEHLANNVVKELVDDLSQIAHIQMETDSSEEDENSYMELVEYVRVAVQNIQVELNSLTHARNLH